MNIDYGSIGLTVGIEAHQQLETRHKLFCNCPPRLSREEGEIRVLRRLRPTQSEMGQVDPAAFFEFQKGKTVIYTADHETSCLVEIDEEPPHQLNDEAIDICLIIALMLKARIVDEIHVMRKIVIDGSNTTGFQRTAIIAMDGTLKVEEKSIPIQNICLEEDAARKTEEREMISHYAIDRLGIPLIEVTTGPVIHTPEEARDVAKAIGRLMRATGRVKRGLGTIRQDLNISITGGAIIEVKGVQRLENLKRVVRFEALRQYNLLEIQKELEKRGVTADKLQGVFVDVTEIFEETRCKIIREALEEGGLVLAVKLPSFHHILGYEIGPNIRFGTEVSDYARFWGGVGGIFHTDELPKYNISIEEREKLKDHMKCQKLDAVIFVADQKERCEEALKMAVERCREAIEGVPPETRAATPDGATRYMRPRPGAERMYPETDVPPIAIDQERIERIRTQLPEMPREKMKRLTTIYGLNKKLATQIINSPYEDLFETIVNDTETPASLVSVTLTETMKSLQRDDVPTDILKESEIIEVFQLLDSGRITKEAIPEILTWLTANRGGSLETAIRELGLDRIGECELEQIAKQILEENPDILEKRGRRTKKVLLGLLMREVRGRATVEEAMSVVDRLI